MNGAGEQMKIKQEDQVCFFIVSTQFFDKTGGTSSPNWWWERSHSVGKFPIFREKNNRCTILIVFDENFKTLTGGGFQRFFEGLKKLWHDGWLYRPENWKCMTKKISKAEFKEKVIESERLSLVKFKTEWSGACQIISPIYDELASSYKNRVNFFTVDVETEKELPGEFGITELPTILFFKRGEIIDHVRGLTPKKNMISKIEEALI